MKRSRRSYLCTLSLSALALTTSQQTFAGYKEDFQKLDEEMLVAQQDFLDARTEMLIAKAAGKLDEDAPEPVDHRSAVLEKMDALAVRAAQTPNGAYIAVQTFLWSAGADAKGTLPRFESIVRNFANAADVADALGVVELIYKESGSTSDWTDLLSRLSRSTEHQAVRDHALLQAGTIHLDAGRIAEARTVFVELGRRTENGEIRETAQAFLFEIDHLQVGRVAPDFTARTFDGQAITLKSLRGKVVLLNFWATWCPNCVAEFAHLEKVFASLEGQPVELLTVSLDDSKQAAARLLAGRKLPGVHTWDQADSANSVAQQYNIRVLPAWFLLDADGVIRHRNPFGEELLPAIRLLLPSRGTSWNDDGT